MISEETRKKLSLKKVGDKHPNWKGGKHDHNGGYMRVWNPNGERILEHRYVMEKHLGRKLEDWEHIHHINGDKKDNRIGNLKLITNAEHGHIHTKDMSDRRCLVCGNSKTTFYKCFIWRTHPITGEKFVCDTCGKRIRRHLGKTN